jgi:hypothetical protein
MSAITAIYQLHAFKPPPTSAQDVQAKGFRRVESVDDVGVERSHRSMPRVKDETIRKRNLQLRQRNLAKTSSNVCERNACGFGILAYCEALIRLVRPAIFSGICLEFCLDGIGTFNRSLGEADHLPKPRHQLIVILVITDQFLDAANHAFRFYAEFENSGGRLNAQIIMRGQAIVIRPQHFYSPVCFGSPQHTEMVSTTQGNKHIVPIMKPVHCRMARAALRLGVRELAKAAKVSTDTVTRFERGDAVMERTVEAIQQALETQGVRFTEDGCVCPPPDRR